MNLNSVRKSWAPLALFLGVALFAVSGNAQTPAPQEEKEVKMEKFVVTGSLIPFAADAPAMPVVSVDVADIERTGTSSSVLEILRKAVPQFVGNGNLGATNANISAGSINGGSQLALLNVQTLVLINGRRVADAPAAANGGYVFVDVNQIPVSAVERIEVVTDGASAIYGTDAISGVVNIILKSDFQGGEIGGRYGFSSNQGHYAERSGWVVLGAVSGKTNITVSAEWYKQDPIYNYERPYSAATYGTSNFPGSVSVGSSYYYLSPSLNAPPTGTHQTAAALVSAGTYSGPLSSSLQKYYFNLSQYVTQWAADQRQTLTLSLDHKVNEQITAFGDFMYSYTHTYTQLNGQPFTASISATNPTNPFNVAVTARNRFFAYPRTYTNNTTLARGVGGLRGNINPDWNWEMAANYNQNTQNYLNGGLINTANRISAVAAGTINMFARTQAPGAVDSSGMVGTALATAVTKLITYDAKVTGKLFTAPGGDVKIAVGVERRVQGLDDKSDVLSQANTFGWDSGTTVNPIGVSRNIDSIFGELRVPLLKDVPGFHYLEASIAGRTEKYSDEGRSTVPKVTLRWLPINDELAFRGTYGKSFTAPTLFELYGLGGIGYTNSMEWAGLNGAEVSGQALEQIGNNPTLKPSKSTNYTFGVTYSPRAIKGYTFSIDYFHFDQKDLISSIDPLLILQDVEFNGAASQYARFVGINNFITAGGTPITAPGQVSGNAIDNVYVTDPSVNLARDVLSGFNFDMRYVITSNSLGKFDINAKALLWNKFSLQFMAGDAYYETAGKVTSTNGTLPRWNGNLAVDWSKGSWGADAVVQYWPAVLDDNDGTRMPNLAQLDLGVSYTFNSKNRFLSGLKVTLGVNNVFNKFGPLDPTTFTDANVDIATYGAIGRFMFAKVQYKF